MYIKDTIKHKERQDLSKLDEVIEHMWIEDQKKLIWNQKLDTIISAITTTWNKTIVIAGDTNIGYNEPSAVFETYKEVHDTYNLKQHVKNELVKVSKPQITLLATSKLKKFS